MGGQPPERVRCVHYVGVGEPEEVWFLSACGGDSFVERPKFPGPALRKFRCREDSDSRRCTDFFRRFPRERGGTVVALIVNDNDGKLSGVILAEEAGDRAGDGCGFVAGWNNGNDARPFFRGLRFEEVFFQSPKVSAQEGKI